MSVPTLDCDLGNTRVKWRFGDSQGEGPFEDRTCFHLLGVSRVLLASVVSPELTAAWERRCQAAWPCVIIETPVVEALPNGFTPIYKKPETMGIDRWLGLAAIWEPGHSICVISCGTATTIDFVDASGQHVGGYIAPGIHLARQALGTHTAKVRSSSTSLFDARLSPGRDTQTCVEHALRLSQVGLIKEAVYRFESQHGDAGLLHLTGGNAGWLAGLVDRPTKVHRNLVLDGLKRVLP